MGQKYWQQLTDDELLESVGNMQRQMDGYTPGLGDPGEDRGYHTFRVRKQEILTELWRRGIDVSG